MNKGLNKQFVKYFKTEYYKDNKSPDYKELYYSNKLHSDTIYYTKSKLYKMCKFILTLEKRSVLPKL